MATKEILRPGTFIDANGKTVVVTKKRLNEFTKNFNSQDSVNSEGRRVPLLLGHPEDESTAPAVGWVKRIFVEGNKLLAEFDKLTEEAEKAIKNFSFRDVSVAALKNVLVHVALTNTPAVSGLADFKFEHLNKDLEILTFVEPKPNGGDMPTELETKLTIEKDKLETKLSDSASLVTEKDEKITELTETNNALEADKVELTKAGEETAKKFSALEKEVSDKVIADELKADTEFVENLCKEGKLKPADKDSTIVVLTSYPKTEIGETTAKAIFMETLSKVGEQIEEGEKLTNGIKPGKEAELVKLSKARAEKDSIPYLEASELVLAEKPHLNEEA